MGLISDGVRKALKADHKGFPPGLKALYRPLNWGNPPADAGENGGKQMTNELAVAGKPGPLANLADMGQVVVGGRDTRLPLSGKGSKKGNYFVGKYLGKQSFKFKSESEKRDADGMETLTVARFSVIETNMEGDSGPVVVGECCSVPFTGLLGWGLEKVGVGRFVFVRFDGKGPGEAKDGTTREMNRFTVTDVTDALAQQGIH